MLAGDQHLANNKAAGEPLAVIPEEAPALSGRFSGVVVLEARHSTKGSQDIVERLVDWNHVNGHFALVEDLYDKNVAGELILQRQVAFVGDAFLMDADPEYVNETKLDLLLSTHDLYISRMSQVSNYVRIGIRNSSIEKLEHLVGFFSKSFPKTIVEKEPINFVSVNPSDWRPDVMWGLDQINAVDAWTFTTGSSDVVVAVIDTGIDITHPDLVDNLWVNSGEVAGDGIDNDGNGLIDDVSGWDFVNGDSVPNDTSGHGTHVSGTIGARGNNGFGNVGVNWNVKILPLRVGDSDFIDTAAVVDALSYIADLKASGVNVVVSNNSYGSGSPSPSMRAQVLRQRDNGILFVAAAGNDGDDIDDRFAEYPAGFVAENVIAVANSNKSDDLSPASNFGATSVDLAAPGSVIYSTYKAGDYEFLSGTSMASPHVAGAVALLASSDSDLSWQELKQRILDTTDPLPAFEGKTVSGGRLNLLSAMKPELKGHFLSISNIEDSIIILDSANVAVQFQTESLSAASVTSEVVEGSGQLTDLGSGLFRFSPSQSGLAKIRFSAELLGVERVVEKTVITGAVSDVLNGLVHRYEFEGESTSTEEDLAGSSDGLFIDAQKVDTDFGQTVQFDTELSKMEFNGNYSSRVTIAALVNSDDLRSSPHPRIVNMPYYYLYYSTGIGEATPYGNRDTLKFFSDREDSFGAWSSMPNSIREDEWFYVVASYDSSDVTNAPSLFINGERQKVRMQQEPKGDPVTDAALSYLGNNGDDTRSFSGLMASVRIYDRELSESEVSQLGAVLVKEKWDQYRVEGVAQLKAGAISSFSVQDIDGESFIGTVNWSVEGGGYDLLEVVDGNLRVIFLDEEDYEVIARVSDGVSTYVFSKSVTSVTSNVLAGVFVGSTNEGGVVWMEINPSSKIGYVSIYDPITGFYRFSEKVEINESGAFSSAESSVGRIVGSITDSLVGEVVGYDVSFSGVSQSVTNLVVANYAGGVLGSAGDSVELRVFEDGRCFIWRKGGFVDLASGSIETDGSFSMVSTKGDEIIGMIDEAAMTVEGTIGGRAFFQKKIGEFSNSRMFGGAFGGSPTGEGFSGLYGSFVEDGETVRSSIQVGFDSPSSPAEGGSELVVLQLEALPHMDASFDLTEIAQAIEEGQLQLGNQPLRAIQAQAPVGDLSAPIIGFSIVGAEPREVLIRGLGPSFANGELENPSASLYEMTNGELVEITTNINWSDGSLFTQEGEKSQGAFRGLEVVFDELSLSPLVFNSQDTAMRVWLSPGVYVAKFEKAAGEPGPALIEVYELP